MENIAFSSAYRVTARVCARLCLRYPLRHSIQLALTLLFTSKTKRTTVSGFLFDNFNVGSSLVKVKQDSKLFGARESQEEE